MKEIKIFHRQAMELTDLALAAQLAGKCDEALEFFKQAYELEFKAAFALADNLEAEPTRSVLLRSAASLALDCKYIAQAEKLICTALAGNPPEQIGEELRDLMEQVHFQRHLELRGISLLEDEIQMSIAGKGIGYGIAPTDSFMNRVEKTEALLYRTAERKLRRPYRDRGRREKTLEDNLELYMTVPRAASFAVTFKVGKGDQLVIPGMSFGEEVIDEVLECLALFKQGEEALLKERIKEDAYYRNFVGLARAIAPDGERVNVVGFTTRRRGERREVALTIKGNDIPLTPEIPAQPIPPKTSVAGGTVEVVGRLKFADSRKKGKDEIQLVDTGNAIHTIVVPPGMMSDIVRPLWDAQVVVTGEQKGTKIHLTTIASAPLKSGASGL